MGSREKSGGIMALRPQQTFNPVNINTVSEALQYLLYTVAILNETLSAEASADFCMAVRIVWTNITDEWSATGPVDAKLVKSVISATDEGLRRMPEVEDPDGGVAKHIYAIESRKRALRALNQDGLHAAGLVLDERLKHQPK